MAIVVKFEPKRVKSIKIKKRVRNAEKRVRIDEKKGWKRHWVNFWFVDRLVSLA